MKLNEVAIAPKDLEQLDLIYRLIGKREEGLAFEPAAIPVARMGELIDGYGHYLKATEAAKEAFEDLASLADRLYSEAMA